jgi:WD40 repeat protein
MVRSFVLNKSATWIALGSTNSIIRCWKFKYNGVLSSIYSLKKHNDPIKCLILNKKENELISCSEDRMINVWKVNCIKNKIKF